MFHNNPNQSHRLKNVSKTQDLRIIALTVCCMDVYPQKDEAHPGGHSVNFAAQCVRKGVCAPAVLGCVGTDGHGWTMINALIRKQINVSHLHIREGKTAARRIYLAAAGEQNSLPGSWDGGVYQNFKLSREDWLFVAAHDIVALPANNPNFPTALKVLGGRGKLVVDFLACRDFQFIATVLPRIAVGFVSGDPAVAARLKPLSAQIEVPLVVTLGAAGSVTLQGGKEFYQEAPPAASVIDTTGCGDSYQAAFAVSWWRERHIPTAMKEGAAAAAATLTHLGGI